MDKTKHFFGQSVFGQLISLIDSDIISQAAKQSRSDHYAKRFKTKGNQLGVPKICKGFGEMK